MRWRNRVAAEVLPQIPEELPPVCRCAADYCHLLRRYPASLASIAILFDTPRLLQTAFLRRKGIAQNLVEAVRIRCHLDYVLKSCPRLLLRIMGSSINLIFPCCSILGGAQSGRGGSTQVGYE